MESLSKILRHKNIATTQIYAKFSTRKLVRICKRYRTNLKDWKGLLWQACKTIHPTALSSGMFLIGQYGYSFRQSTNADSYLLTLIISLSRKRIFRSSLIKGIDPSSLYRCNVRCGYATLANLFS